MKAGVEAIIEDEVTSRFEAEELKNWNILTRTNRYYEFISYRLTIIWFIGFFVRYFILMPFRVIICFVGVSFCTHRNCTIFVSIYVLCSSSKRKRCERRESLKFDRFQLYSRKKKNNKSNQSRTTSFNYSMFQ